MEVNTEIKIDYFSATFPLHCDIDDSVKLRVDEMIMIIAQYLNVHNFEIEYKPTAQNNFKYQVELGSDITLRLDGPVNKYYQRTCHLEMKGKGCREFERRNKGKTWNDLILFMSQLNASFKRIDIAIDDYKGDIIDMQYLYDKVINDNAYTSIFKAKPKPIGTLDDGLTIQFGSNMSNTELVIYDKAKEQEHRKQECDKDYWVRYEMRFRDKNADAIAFMLALIFEEDGLQHFAREQLYRILDIKESNNYSRADQKKNDTDEKWIKFLDGVEKGALLKPEDTSAKNLESYMKVAMPYAVFVIAFMYMTHAENKHMTEIAIWKMMRDHLEFSKHRFKTLNTFLFHKDVIPIDDDKLVALRDRFDEFVTDMELPF